jgi:hypothetical protein
MIINAAQAIATKATMLYATCLDFVLDIDLELALLRRNH